MPDLPRPEGEKAQGTPFVTHESMGRSLGSQKKVLGRVIGVEKRLGNAEKKITILKNILKMRQQSENIGGVIKGIEESVDAIAETTGLQYQEDLQAAEDKRLQDEKDDAKAQEGKLEKKKSPIISVAEKALAPVKSVFQKIIGFLQTFLLGAGLMKLFEWFSDPKNSEKVQTIFRFVKDWWPALLAGLMAFLPALLGPAGMIIGTVALLAWGIPKIIDAVKSIFGMGKDVDKELANNEKTLNKDIQKQEGGVTPPETGETEQKQEKATGDDLAAVNEERGMFGQQELPSPPEQEESTQAFKDGGIVQGPGGVDKVPARLTAGEFVMSKGAVDQWGAGTLAGMNAAAGGSNQPTNGGYNGGGLVNLHSHLNKNNYSNSSKNNYSHSIINNKSVDVDVRPTQNIIPYEGKEYRKKYQFGGAVTGRGGNDNVPAKLTAGEFVMSKSAVNTFGANTFAAMNASGGGTNIPTEHHFAGGGLVQPTGNNRVSPPGTPISVGGIEIIPAPFNVGESGAVSGPQGSGSNVPSFGVVAWGGEPKEHVLGIRR